MQPVLKSAMKWTIQFFSSQKCAVRQQLQFAICSECKSALHAFCTSILVHPQLHRLYTRRLRGRQFDCQGPGGQGFWQKVDKLLLLMAQCYCCHYKQPLWNLKKVKKERSKSTLAENVNNNYESMQGMLLWPIEGSLWQKRLESAIKWKVTSLCWSFESHCVSVRESD